MKPLSDIIPDALQDCAKENEKPMPDCEAWTRGAFASLLKHANLWVDRQDALQRYEPIRAILCDSVDFLDYCVKSHQSGIEPTPHSAREYARFREDEKKN